MTRTSVLLNRVLGAILSSPLHPLLSDKRLVLTFTGRRRALGPRPRRCRRHPQAADVRAEVTRAKPWCASSSPTTPLRRDRNPRLSPTRHRTRAARGRGPGRHRPARAARRRRRPHDAGRRHRLRRHSALGVPPLPGQGDTRPGGHRRTLHRLHRPAPDRRRIGRRAAPAAPGSDDPGIPSLRAGASGHYRVLFSAPMPAPRASACTPRPTTPGRRPTGGWSRRSPRAYPHPRAPRRSR